MQKKMNEMLTLTVSDYLSLELAEKIAEAQWHRREWACTIKQLLYDGKVSGDCFRVVAKNERDEVVGSLFCLRNQRNPKLWYYGDLFVVPEYRRRHIAEKMLLMATNTLCDRDCRMLRTYVEPENTASLRLQEKLGFVERPYEIFDDLLNEGQLMFEKELSHYVAVPAESEWDARFITIIYMSNVEVLHGTEILYKEWCQVLSEKDSDEAHFLIHRGAMPCAWLKLNGLADSEIGWLSMLAVEPTYQRRGVGEYAVHFAEEYLRGKGKRVVAIHTTEDNLPAKKLYEKCGYVLTAMEEREGDDGKRRLCHTYEKVIQ